MSTINVPELEVVWCDDRERLHLQSILKGRCDEVRAPAFRMTLLVPTGDDKFRAAKVQVWTRIDGALGLNGEGTRWIVIGGIEGGYQRLPDPWCRSLSFHGLVDVHVRKGTVRHGYGQYDPLDFIRKV